MKKNGMKSAEKNTGSVAAGSFHKAFFHFYSCGAAECEYKDP